MSPDQPFLMQAPNHPPSLLRACTARLMGPMLKVQYVHHA